MQSLNLTIPHKRDPLARLTLFALVGLVAWLGVTQPSPQAARATGDVIILATPALPTLAPTAVPPPTVAPVVVDAAPTMPPIEPPPPPEPQVIQQVIVQQVIIVATPTEAPEQPTMLIITATPIEIGVQVPSGAIIIQTATPGPSDPGFADSFQQPDPQAKCQFVGCL